ncbi:hypothetical protein R5R35_011322 [Gryllus longicercus]|uniref:Uncharacterized protein n=1 Tax=Gryllus longicercus TaxID=2509291 RepID=A0AAN9W3V2_9ORTH
MLKWTVGHRKGGGSRRSPPGGGGGGNGGPCYSIRRAAARLQQAARRSGGGSASRGAAAGDKENRDHEDALSPRTRDSVYMRLDSIPAALRDLSNQLAPAPAPASASTPTHRPRSSLVKTPVSAGRRPRNSAAKARRARTPRSPCGGDRDSDSGVAPLPPSPAPTLPPRLPPAGAAPSAPAPAVLAPAAAPLAPFPPPPAAAATTTTTTTASLSSTTTKRGAASPLRIEYSPCPLRATRSLLALRRRLADAFAQPHAPSAAQHRSVGTLHPLAPAAAPAPAPAPASLQTSHDNPLYFTLVRPLRLLGAPASRAARGPWLPRPRDDSF